MKTAKKLGMWMMASGVMMPVMPKDGKKFSLQEVQKLVGGYVERINLSKRGVMLVNEEGLPRGLRQNAEASIMAGRPIVGDVVVLPRGMGW